MMLPKKYCINNEHVLKYEDNERYKNFLIKFFFLFKCSHILLSFFFLLYFFLKNYLNKIQYSDPNTPFSSWSIWILNAQPRNKIIKLFFLKALVKIYMSCAWGCPTNFCCAKNDNQLKCACALMENRISNDMQSSLVIVTMKLYRSKMSNTKTQQ